MNQRMSPYLTRIAVTFCTEILFKAKFLTVALWIILKMCLIHSLCPKREITPSSISLLSLREVCLFDSEVAIPWTEYVMDYWQVWFQEDLTNSVKYRFHYYKNSPATCCALCAWHKLKNGIGLRQVAADPARKYVTATCCTANGNGLQLVTPLL